MSAKKQARDWTNEDIVGLEAKHNTYVRAQDYSNNDAVIFKEVVHLKDGRRIPRLRTFKNYRRPFWITQKGRQNHSEKKDYELTSNLTRYETTQIEMPGMIARLLGDYSHGPRPPLKKLARSPYLYGTDVTSGCLIKREYDLKYPELTSRNTVAAGDIETDLEDPNEPIIMMSVTFKDKVYLAIDNTWLEKRYSGNAIKAVKECADKHIGHVLKERNIEIEIGLLPTPVDIVKECIARLHEWKPDFFTFWNMEFDIKHMIADLERADVQPEDVFSDPTIPGLFRYFNFREGQRQKVTASGKTSSINIEDRWAWVTHPASFQFIDAMTVYRNLRIAEGKEPSYTLDAILKKELGMTKLKFDEAQDYTGLRWHQVMQKQYPIEYAVYNIFDSIALELLDEKTGDLAFQISTMSGYSDFKNFNSNPKRLCDALHFSYLDNLVGEEAVIASSSDDPTIELDQYVIGADNWIVTLPSYMADPNGMACVEELDDYKTLMYLNVSDLDVKSSYPHGSILLNIARESNAMELSRIEHVPNIQRRALGVNLTCGRVNSVEICQQVLKAPMLDELLDEFIKEKGLDKAVPELESFIDISQPIVRSMIEVNIMDDDIL